MMTLTSKPNETGGCRVPCPDGLSRTAADNSAPQQSHDGERVVKATLDAAVAGLLGELGYPATPGEVAGRLAVLIARGEPPLLAERRGEVVGLVSWTATPVLHRSAPVGRISALAVAEAVRGQGIGRRLLEALESRLADLGVRRIEVATAEHRDGAHRFYAALGYARTGVRYAKALG